MNQSLGQDLGQDTASPSLGARTGPSFAAALCGFLSTTVATTALMFLLSSV
jgi:hypothetical protein